MSFNIHIFTRNGKNMNTNPINRMIVTLNNINGFKILFLECFNEKVITIFTLCMKVHKLFRLDSFSSNIRFLSIDFNKSTK